jgi:hypothetical protein
VNVQTCIMEADKEIFGQFDIAKNNDFYKFKHECSSQSLMHILIKIFRPIKQISFHIWIPVVFESLKERYQYMRQKWMTQE